MMIPDSIPRLLLSIIPLLLLLWISEILWKVRKDLNAVVPIAIGIFLLALARGIDVLFQHPFLWTVFKLDMSSKHVADTINSIGDLADAIGVFLLVTGFIQSVKYQIDKKKHIEDLETLIPICATCKKIRKPDNTWESIEDYLRQVGAPPITHGICPECKAELLRERDLIKSSVKIQQIKNAY